MQGISCSLIAAGESHSLALSGDRGQLYTWGLGDYGNLGHGDNRFQPMPRIVEVLLGKKCVSVACGAKHTRD